MQRGFWEFVNKKISPADCRLAFSFKGRNLGFLILWKVLNRLQRSALKMQRGFWEFVNKKISPADCRLAFSFKGAKRPE